MSKAAGHLTERVGFDQPTTTPNGMGGTVLGWQRVVETWAGFTFLRGGEIVLQGRLSGRQPIVVRVRSARDTRLIEADWRMVDLRTGDIYNIRSIVPTPDRQWLDLTCERGVAV